MKVIRQNRKPQQIDAETRCELPQIVLDPDLAMIEVFPRDRVLSHQEAAPGGAIKKMADRHFVGIKHFASSQTSHHTPRQGTSSKTGKSEKSTLPAFG